MDEILASLIEAIINVHFKYYMASSEELSKDASEHREEQDVFFAAIEKYMRTYVAVAVENNKLCKDVDGQDNSKLRAKICELLNSELPLWAYKRYVALKEEREWSGEYDSEKKKLSDEFIPRLKSQTDYYIRKHLEEEGKLSGMKEWVELEEAYFIAKGEKNFEETEIKKKLDDELKAQYFEFEKLNQKKNTKKAALEEMEDII